MTDIVKLIDGREMPAGCWLVKADREVMKDHLGAMWRAGTTEARRVYIETVRRAQGDAWAEALKQRFADEWEAKREDHEQRC